MKLVQYIPMSDGNDDPHRTGDFNNLAELREIPFVARWLKRYDTADADLKICISHHLSNKFVMIDYYEDSKRAWAVIGGSVDLTDDFCKELGAWSADMRPMERSGE